MKKRVEGVKRKSRDELEERNRKAEEREGEKEEAALGILLMCELARPAEAAAAPRHLTAPPPPPPSPTRKGVADGGSHRNSA